MGEWLPASHWFQEVLIFWISHLTRSLYEAYSDA